MEKIFWSGFAREILAGGKKYGERLAESATWQGHVAIIGAGAAGLSAAYLLMLCGMQVTVLEASDRIGGRVKSHYHFADFPIELGAEEIHGDESVLFDMVQRAGGTLLPHETLQNYIVIEGRPIPYAQACQEIGVQNALACVDRLLNADGICPCSCVTIADHLSCQEVSPAYHHIVDFFLGNEYGASNADLGVAEVIHESDLWSCGDTNYWLVGISFAQLLDQVFTDVYSCVRCNQCVQELAYSDTDVQIRTTDGQEYHVDAAIVTVPLPILKKDVIHFCPALPSSKRAAIARLGMSGGIKVILKFTEQFWPDDMGYLINEGLVCDMRVISTGKGSKECVMMAYLFGPRGEVLREKYSDIAECVVAELDKLYGHNVATRALHESLVIDWQEEPHILGAYSYPAPGSLGDFEILAKPVGRSLFFAGEATNFEGHHGTVHGAIESGLRAAYEVLTR